VNEQSEIIHQSNKHERSNDWIMPLKSCKIKTIPQFNHDLNNIYKILSNSDNNVPDVVTVVSVKSEGLSNAGSVKDRICLSENINTSKHKGCNMESTTSDMDLKYEARELNSDKSDKEVQIEDEIDWENHPMIKEANRAEQYSKDVKRRSFASQVSSFLKNINAYIADHEEEILMVMRTEILAL